MLDLSWWFLSDRRGRLIVVGVAQAMTWLCHCLWPWQWGILGAGVREEGTHRSRSHSKWQVSGGGQAAGWPDHSIVILSSPRPNSNSKSQCPSPSQTRSAINLTYLQCGDGTWHINFWWIKDAFFLHFKCQLSHNETSKFTKNLT